jgi:Domain of unknown function (DUF4192)
VSPLSVLAIVPHLLGFLPESSVVVIGTDAQQGRVRVTLRYDLPERPDGGLAEDIAEHAISVLAAQHLAAAVVVGYGPQERVAPLVAAFTAAARRAGIELREALRAEGGKYWSYTCTNEKCCPPGGTAYDIEGQAAVTPLDPGGGPVLPSRGALAGSIAPLAGQAAEAMRLATRRAEQHATQIIAKVRRSSRIGAARHMIASEGLAAVAEMVSLYRGGGRYATDYQLAWLCVALKDLRVRDDAWARMDPRHRLAHRRLWTDVVRRAQPGYAPAPASLLAFVAWQDGNGALANVALDRALADDPGYTMALLLREVLNAGAPPAMARPPLTPEEVAECYDGECEADEDPGEGESGGVANRGTGDDQRSQLG